MKFKWITILLIFLLTLNAALVATLLIRKPDKTPPRLMRGHVDRPELRKGKFHHFLIEQLAFTSEQTDSLEAIRKDFYRSKRLYNIKLKGLKNRYIKQLTTEVQDTVILKQLTDSIGLVTGELLMLEYEHFRNIRALCNPEQAVLLDSIGKAHMHKMNRDFPGRNRRQGHGAMLNKNRN